MISFLGLCIINFWQTLKYIFGGNVKKDSVMARAAMISYDSLPIALSIVFIASVVIALQVSKQFLMSGAESYVGGFLAVALIRELAPGFAALAINARAGTAISAEIANMQAANSMSQQMSQEVGVNGDGGVSSFDGALNALKAEG